MVTFDDLNVGDRFIYPGTDVEYYVSEKTDTMVEITNPRNGRSNSWYLCEFEPQPWAIIPNKKSKKG